jgi:hypothetical protein
MLASTVGQNVRKLKSFAAQPMVFALPAADTLYRKFAWSTHLILFAPITLLSRCYVGS